MAGFSDLKNDGFAKEILPKEVIPWNVTRNSLPGGMNWDMVCSDLIEKSGIKVG